MSARFHQQLLAAYVAPSVGGGGGVTWTGVLNATHSAGTISKTLGSWNPAYGNSVETISSGGTGYFEFDSIGLPESRVFLWLGPASGSPYTSRGSSPGIYIVLQDAYIEFRDVTDFSYQGNVSYTPGSDVVRFGFDGSNHMRVWLNGTPVFTDDESVTTEDQILFVEFSGDGSAGIGIENVIIGS